MNLKEEAQLAAYEQLCQTHRAMDSDLGAKLLGFLPKLLGFLPLVVGAGLALTTGKSSALSTDLLPPLGVFGLAVTLGLFLYQLYNFTRLHTPIEAGMSMEKSMGLDGQFSTRPRALLGIGDETFAAAIVYPAVMAAWIYLALIQASPGVRTTLAGLVFGVGFVVTIVFSRWLEYQTRVNAFR